MVLCVLSLIFTPSFVSSELPVRPADSYVSFQSFSDPDWDKKWVITPLTNYTGKWEIEPTTGAGSIPNEKMIFMKTGNAYYGLSTEFETPLDPRDQTLIVQYELRTEGYIECGGSYIKLFGRDNFSPQTLCNETRYIIMFGPDKCGPTNKIHFIFRHRHPVTGVYEEKHLSETPAPPSGKGTHLYTLIVRPDNTFEILVDGQSSTNGSLLTSFEPPVNPPAEIDDPTDHKPSDWVDKAEISDPDDQKPSDWDESEPEFLKDSEKLEPPPGWLLDEPPFIPDPEMSTPDDWDEDIQGEWEAPTIPNPKCEDAPGCGEYEPPLVKNPAYKGKWKARKIPNPDYRGPWKARQIPNPGFFEDLNPHNFEPIVGAGFELWMVDKEVGFGNVYIGTDEIALKKWNDEHFLPKFQAQEEEQGREEPTPKPKRKKGAGEAGGGFLAALQDFAGQLADAWNDLFEENAAAMVLVSVFFGVAFVVLPVLACCRPRPKRSARRAKRKAAGTGAKAEPAAKEDAPSQRAPRDPKE
jgi:calnexin